MFPKTLAIDYGEKKIGLALSYGTLSEPLEILPNNDQLVTAIENICVREQVEQIVVGMSENISAQRSQLFGEQLAVLNIPVFYADETLSTKKAQELIRQTKGKAYRGQDDHIAAAVFLQEWIDTHQ